MTKMRGRAGPDAAQPVRRLDDRRPFTKEDVGVLGFERFWVAIGLAGRLAVGRPGEKFWVEPRFFQSSPLA